MAWAFRKRIKFIPGVTLNLSRRGVSTTIGPRGANVNFGRHGTYLNTGIPGTGIYNRQRLTKIGKTSPPHLAEFSYPEEPKDNIASTDVLDITSKGMAGIKEAILAAQRQRVVLGEDIASVKRDKLVTELLLMVSYVLLYGLIFKRIAVQYKADIAEQDKAIGNLQAALDSCFVEIHTDISSDLVDKYETLQSSFLSLAQSERVWDVTGEYMNDAIATRTSNGLITRRTMAKVGMKSNYDIKSDYEAMWLSNSNGPDLYIYPGFVVLFETEATFAVVDYSDISLSFQAARFIEDGEVPQDAELIDRTWARVNKNGSRDKRFKGNYQIPVVRYGNIDITTHTGMNERWQFSNASHAAIFEKCFNSYQSAIMELGRD